MQKLGAKLKTFLLTDNISILIKDYSKKFNNLFVVYRNYNNTNTNINFNNILKLKSHLFNFKNPRIALQNKFNTIIDGALN